MPTSLAAYRRIIWKVFLCSGASVSIRESDGLARLPHLHQWFRTSLAVIMYLTNGTLQVVNIPTSISIRKELMTRQQSQVNYVLFRVIRFVVFKIFDFSIKAEDDFMTVTNTFLLLFNVNTVDSIPYFFKIFKHENIHIDLYFSSSSSIYNWIIQVLMYTKCIHK